MRRRRQCLRRIVRPGQHQSTIVRRPKIRFTGHLGQLEPIQDLSVNSYVPGFQITDYAWEVVSMNCAHYKRDAWDKAFQANAYNGVVDFVQLHAGPLLQRIQAPRFTAYMEALQELLPGRRARAFGHVDG